jgi:dienelactone hydrolase
MRHQFHHPAHFAVLAVARGNGHALSTLEKGDACTLEKGPGTDGFAPWARQWTTLTVVADLDALMATLPPKSKVGVVGFCWGTFAALLAASGGGAGATKRGADAACFVHPSHRKIMEVVHGMAPEEVGEYYVGGIRAPTLCLAAGNDDSRCKPNGVDEILIREACPIDPKFVEFATMKHGWVIKGDIDDPETAKAVPEAVGLITGWLDQHLARGSLI